MADTFTREQRSAMMSRVKNRNTAVEVKVRSLLHRMGYRFRLHRTDLPGTPDIVLPRLRKVIFVHGCLWHAHEGCRRGRYPSSNTEFWTTKIRKNIERDRLAQASLKLTGWAVLVIWQCQTNNIGDLRSLLLEFLQSQ